MLRPYCAQTVRLCWNSNRLCWNRKSTALVNRCMYFNLPWIPYLSVPSSDRPLVSLPDPDVSNPSRVQVLAYLNNWWYLCYRHRRDQRILDRTPNCKRNIEGAVSYSRVYLLLACCITSFDFEFVLYLKQKKTM